MRYIVGIAVAATLAGLLQLNGVLAMRHASVLLSSGGEISLVERVWIASANWWGSYRVFIVIVMLMIAIGLARYTGDSRKSTAPAS